MDFLGESLDATREIPCKFPAGRELPGQNRTEGCAQERRIRQITPAPRGLWVIRFAYLIDGGRAALMALLAVSIPPFTALLAHSILTKYQSHPFARGFVRGLTLAVAAIFVVIISNIMIQTGIDVASIIIAIGALGLALSKRVPVPVILLIAGTIGAWYYQ
jgi:chromate transport protein ChrA